MCTRTHVGKYNRYCNSGVTVRDRIGIGRDLGNMKWFATTCLGFCNRFSPVWVPVVRRNGDLVKYTPAVIHHCF